MYCNCDCVCFISDVCYPIIDTKIQTNDSYRSIRGLIVLVKRRELEQFNSYNVVTDNGRLVKFITSKKGVN